MDLSPGLLDQVFRTSGVGSGTLALGRGIFACWSRDEGRWPLDRGPRSMSQGPVSQGPRTVDKSPLSPLQTLFISYPEQYTGPMTQTSKPPLPDHPSDGAADSPMDDNAPWLSALGLATRFGPDWPGKRCLAKTQRGTECQRPAITGSARCRLHGGRSTGPRTEEGRARISAANTKHGRKTKERLAEARARAQANREIWYALKTQIELAIRDGYLPKNYRPRG